MNGPDPTREAHMLQLLGKSNRAPGHASGAARRLRGQSRPSAEIGARALLGAHSALKAVARYITPKER